MRSQLAALAIFTITLSLPAEEHHALGLLQSGSLQVYSVSPSGEIGVHQIASDSNSGSEVLIDNGGRAVCIRGSNDEILLYRINPNRTLSLSDSEDAGAGAGYVESLAMSQDGRMILGLRQVTNSVSSSFRTFHVNNRLQLTSTGHSSGIVPGNLSGWTISDYSRYTAITLSGSSADVAGSVHIDQDGQIANSAELLFISFNSNGRFDLDPSGRWTLTGHQLGATDASLLGIESDGSLLPQDAHAWHSVWSVANQRFIPNLSGAVLASAQGLVTADLTEDMKLGNTIDTESPGIGVPSGLAVSPDSTMILMDDQVTATDFPLFSFHLNPDNTLDSTGNSLSRTGQHTDLRFIPPPTLPTVVGDANVDGVFNAADLVFVVNEALPDNKPLLNPQSFSNADLDGDIDVDADDFSAMIQMLLHN